ncbi:MAG TPA: response regulator transcription factor [Burkholderiaceae bacterium]|nr:response regulator transcription factor [Burkholderiaceae bacterium]
MANGNDVADWLTEVLEGASRAGAQARVQTDAQPGAQSGTLAAMPAGAGPYNFSESNKTQGAQSMAQPDSTANPVVMVVDDEPELRTLLGEYLARYGIAVRTAADSAAARALVAESAPDLAILDINMPGENGLSLARWLRESHPGMGLLMLTTASESVDRVVGLEMGADDYLPKPFELRELLARVRAILRRTHSTPAAATAEAQVAEHRVRFGLCQLDLEQRRLFGADGEPVEISAAEFDLMALFARHPNRPLNRDQIMEQAHNRGWDVFDRSIDLRIMRLRRKIERNPDKPEIIKTVRNVGYVFVSS